MAIRKILIIEDSPTDRTFLESLLVKAGYQCITASSGEEGVAVSKAQQPDLILMDVVMPGLNGFQATRAITREPATKHIPVFICTTKGQETDKIWGMRQGAKDYIVKPINVEDLLAKIKALG